MESSGFVGYVKKVKNERGTLCSKFALVELGLSELISFCKKWYIRDELCGLTKKKKLATVIVGLFSLKENAPTKNRRRMWVRLGVFSDFVSMNFEISRRWVLTKLVADVFATDKRDFVLVF